MSPELQGLIQLQQVEAAAAEARARIAAHPQRIAEADARLEEAERIVTEATERLKASQEQRRALEKDAAVYQGRLTKFKDQLSAVKTNREYQAMQHEIETAQKDLGAAEEKVLERMLEADELTALVKKAEAERAAKKKAIEAEKAQMQQELVAVERALTEATAARDTVIASMSKPTVALFEQVSRARKGVAICEATRDGLCSQCHVRLRPPVFQQVRANDSIVQCESCRRILFYVPPPPQVETPVTRAAS
jgi:predicted  nucleic acid-binding Zn-ribbon protein